MLADRIESALGRGELLDELLRGLRDPSASVPANLDVAAVQQLRTAVFDAIEASATAHEMRVLAEWFATAIERALGDANRRFVAMLDAIDDRLILLDPSARVLFLNRASEAAARGMHGVSREDMVGRSSIEGTHSPAYEHYVAGMIARAAAGETVGGEFLLPLADGAIWHDHQFHPVRRAGEVEAIAVTSREIHARKQAEGRLQLLSKIALLAESNELDSVLARAAGLAIPELADWSVFELVQDGAIHRSTVVHPDPERRTLGERLLGGTARRVEHLAGRVLDDFEGASDPLRALLRQFEVTSAIVVPFVVMGVPIALATFAFGPESGRRHTPADLAIADEIARRAAQIVENARLHAELAQALAYRDRVMGILGHDLRNPVAAVLSLAATLGNRADVPDRTKEGLRHIHAAAARMNQMIATILDFTRLRFHGQLVLALDYFDLATLVHGIVEELRASHPAREIAIEAAGALRGRWDASRLGQVVSNLVGNALTHGARESPVLVRLAGEPEHVTVAVTNRGPTIPSDVIGKLFEPFWQGAAKSRGLGLGLLIAEQIVQAHGGEIAVESHDERTTFTVRLPRG